MLARWPQAQRLEFCLGPEGVVTREGGAPLGAECRAAPGDQLTPGSWSALHGRPCEEGLNTRATFAKSAKPTSSPAP